MNKKNKLALSIVFAATKDVLKAVFTRGVLFMIAGFCAGMFNAYMCGALSTDHAKQTEKYNKVMMKKVLQQQNIITCYKAGEKGCSKKKR